MRKGRLEAFSDGVIAIIITIMVLELRVPHSSQISDLLPLWPKFLSYVLSFIYIGIYWNNHHHIIYSVEKINGASLWANLNLLFWLSLVPFVTEWMGENEFSKWPVILYGVVLIMNGMSYNILARILIRQNGEKSALGIAYGKDRDRKGRLSVLMYAIGIALSFWNPWIGFTLYALVALVWFIPDQRIEKQVSE